MEGPGRAKAQRPSGFGMPLCRRGPAQVATGVAARATFFIGGRSNPAFMLLLLLLSATVAAAFAAAPTSAALGCPLHCRQMCRPEQSIQNVDTSARGPERPYIHARNNM